MRHCSVRSKCVRRYCSRQVYLLPCISSLILYIYITRRPSTGRERGGGEERSKEDKVGQEGDKGGGVSIRREIKASAMFRIRSSMCGTSRCPYISLQGFDNTPAKFVCILPAHLQNGRPGRLACVSWLGGAQYHLSRWSTAAWLSPAGPAYPRHHPFANVRLSSLAHPSARVSWPPLPPKKTKNSGELE